VGTVVIETFALVFGINCDLVSELLEKASGPCVLIVWSLVKALGPCSSVEAIVICKSVLYRSGIRVCVRKSVL
jgi:hypothetical protein